MTRTTKITITLSVASTLFFGVLLLVLQPVPLPSDDNTVLVQGLVTSIEADESTHDIWLEIEGDDDSYYVNRGLELGFQREELDALLHKKISLYYIETSSPLESLVGDHHISRIEVANEVLFDEMEAISSIDLAAN